MNQPTVRGGGPVSAFMLAGSLKHACNSAVIDWGWSRAGEFEFQTPWGERVRYVGDWRRQLVGRPRGTRLFFGFGSYQQRDIGELEELVRLGSFVEASPTLPPPEGRA